MTTGLQVRNGRPTVVKIGGELMEDTIRLQRLARTLAALASREPIVVVHGGGREVDANMAKLDIKKRSVDGLRITDDATLDVAVCVLAGRINTRLVAALGTAGSYAVGLTGVDSTVATVRREQPYRTTAGKTVDLGHVGRPQDASRPTLLFDLLKSGYVPVIASISADSSGQLYNVNADTLAGHLAGCLGARRLIIAGGTSGVLNCAGQTMPVVNDEEITRLIADGHASAGMVAKLLACRAALQNGVTTVAIVNGRSPTPRLFDDEIAATMVTR